MALPIPLPEPADEAGQWSGRDEADAVGPMSFEEYLEYDDPLGRKCEYVAGMVYAMAYERNTHGTICTNLILALGPRARRAGCGVYTQGRTVHTPRDRGYVPDFLIRCGEPPHDDSRFDENACLIVEVLSPSTRRTDETEKLDEYQKFSALQAYWTVESTWRCVRRHWRNAGGAWQFEEIVGTGEIPVPCVGGPPMTLDELYETLRTPYDPPRPRLRRIHEELAEYEVGADDPTETDAADTETADTDATEPVG